jgi:hypothetical protein
MEIASSVKDDAMKNGIVRQSVFGKMIRDADGKKVGAIRAY